MSAPRLLRFAAPALALALIASLGLPAAGQAATPRRLSAALAADVRELAPTTAYQAIVRFRAGAPADHRAFLAARGLAVTGELRRLPIVAVKGPLAAVAALGTHPAVDYVEPNHRLEYFGDTSVWATRVGVVQHAVSGGPYRDGGGAILDGAGIGVAVVDSGVDAGHPDLVNRVATNYKWLTDSDMGSGNSDQTSGHGTHVSGIVAGDGTASQGTYKGVAPGSSLHVFSSGEVLSVFAAVISFEKIYNDFASFTPPIRVINNSWGNPAGSDYDPNGTIEELVGKLVTEKGALVVFAAGNNGGDGTSDNTSGYCKDPTPGVICVANYDDNETGDRDFALDATSSRAKASDPVSLYPDVSAPGAFITSTFRPTSGALYGSFIFPSLGWQPNYADAGGTSMAAPHLSGIAALLLQAKPNLTPAGIEDILLDTAHKFTAGGPYVADPQNAGQTTSFDKGAGLADAVAALIDPRIGVTGDNAASPTALAAGDAGDVPLHGAADLVSASVNPTNAGLEYTVTVANADQRPPSNVAFRVFSFVNGKDRRTTVNLKPDGTVAPVAAEAPDDPATAEADTVSRSGNSVTFFVPNAELGGPPSKSAVHNVQVASYIGVIQDVAPSPANNRTGADIFLRPLYPPPFTVGF